MVQERNQVIRDWLIQHTLEIEKGEIKVFALDECHLKGGDICGYGWGDKKQRREIEIDNYKKSQTYYGALDCRNGSCILSRQEKADTKATIAFVKKLLALNEGKKIVLIWDGASYHRSEEWKEFLTEINSGEDWKIHCLRFAPYAPEENPIENLWGQVKQLLRQLHCRCRSFGLTKKIFELFFRHQLFTMPNLKTHRVFSSII